MNEAATGIVYGLGCMALAIALVAASLAFVLGLLAGVIAK